VEVPEITVLYCFAEGDGGIRARTEAAARKYELTESQRERLLLVDTVPDLKSTEGLLGLDDELAARIRGGLMIVDNYVLSVGNTDTNRNTETALLFKNMRRFCQEREVAIVLIHHVSKGETRPGPYGATGSYQFGASCDVILEVDRPSNIVCQVTKCRDGRELSEFYFRITEVSWEAGGREQSGPTIEPATGSLKLTANQKVLLRALAERDIDSEANAVKVSQLALYTDEEPSNVHPHLNGLVRYGLVKIVKKDDPVTGKKAVKHVWLERSAYGNLQP
jgi:hypothetical protein